MLYIYIYIHIYIYICVCEHIYTYIFIYKGFYYGGEREREREGGVCPLAYGKEERENEMVRLCASSPGAKAKVVTFSPSGRVPIEFRRSRDPDKVGGLAS